METFKEAIFRITEKLVKQTPICACGCGKHVGIQKRANIRYRNGRACHQRAYRAKKRKTKVPIQKACAWCNHSWYPKTSRAKFCSNACKQANHRHQPKNKQNQ